MLLPTTQGQSPFLGCITHPSRFFTASLARWLLSSPPLPAAVHPFFRRHYNCTSSRSRPKWGAHSNPTTEHRESVIPLHHSIALSFRRATSAKTLDGYRWHTVCITASKVSWWFSNSNPSIGYSVPVFSEPDSWDLGLLFQITLFFLHPPNK